MTCEEPLKILSTRPVRVVYAIDIYNIHSGRNFTFHAFTKKAALRMANCYIFERAVHIRKLKSYEYFVFNPLKNVNKEGENA